MWEALFKHQMRSFIKHGAIRVSLPSGAQAEFGKAKEGERPFRVTITKSETLRRLMLDPELALGEAYMDGTIVFENDDIREFLRITLSNVRTGGEFSLQRLLQRGRTFLRRISQRNTVIGSQRNVKHHYDLSDDLYRMFLDKDMMYSCAYFKTGEETLEQAQIDKKRHIIGKLLLEEGMSVLDIGSGWGGLGLTMAKEFGANVTGVTLSENQFSAACKRAEEAKLGDRLKFKFKDYREVTGGFDRIVSVGMLEHVGAPQYRTFFRTVKRLLAEKGVALVHTIGRTTPPGVTNPWITKHIFPGGYVPAMSELLCAIEREGLVVTDIEVLRTHYAETLRHWHDRFTRNLDKVRRMYDERFCRMWRFYLISCEMGFRMNGQEVFQIQLAHEMGDVPTTRDYLYASSSRASAAGRRKAKDSESRRP